MRRGTKTYSSNKVNSSNKIICQMEYDINPQDMNLSVYLNAKTLYITHLVKDK